MDNALFIVVLVTAAVVVGAAAFARYVGHFRIGERAAARIATYKIENASPDLALNDPQLRALITCPSCGTAGDFDVVSKKQCKCRKCGHAWNVAS